MVALTLTLRTAEKPNYQWGSAFHGMLMSLLPAETAACFHGDGQKYLSQWIEPIDAHRLQWHIHILNEELAVNVADALAAAGTLHSLNRHAEFPVLRADCLQQDPGELLDQAFAKPAPQSVTLHVMTPATHKSAGRYVTLPTAEIIARSLARRFRSVWPETVFDHEEMVTELTACLHIGRYALSSASYGIGGAYVLGYIGQAEIYMDGTEEQRMMLHALFAFAPWIGIGGKTALGMGGCRIL